MHKPRIVILLSRFPFPLEKGDKLRAYHQIKFLSQHFDICLIALSNQQTEENYLLELKPFCHQIHLLQLSKFKSICNAGLALFSKTPFQVAYFYQSKVQQKITTIIEDFNPQIIYTQLARMAKYTFALQHKKVLDYQDAFSLNYSRSAAFASFPFNILYNLEAKRIAYFEQSISKKFDATTIISAIDAKALNVKSVVVKNGVDTDYFGANDNPIIFDILFVGNLGYLPNVLAVEFIVQKIYPLLLVHHPQCKLLIAGANPSAKIMAYANANITIQAWLPDIRDAYQQAKIFIAPLFTGAGLQNKLLEAMSMQLPCITTPICNSSLNAVDGQQILIANSAEEFVQEINLLLNNENLRLQLGLQGRQMILQNYNWTSENTILLQLLTSVMQQA
jgi:polysaccharide biosynthesis protein PslH